MKRHFLYAAPALALILSLGSLTTARADEPTYALVLKDHRFDPSTLEIPANQKVKLTIKNMDATAEEFDSDDLHREKVIAPGTTGVVYVGPLSPGKYAFQGEYHPDTAKGTIIAR